MANFTIISQRQFPRASPAGGFEQVWEVTYKAHCGAVGKVDIPVDGYSPQKVIDTVSPLADVLCQVSDIGK